MKPSRADAVIAFDVDNTLLDADGRAYEQTLSEFLSMTDLGVELDGRTRAYEELRSMGDALERLGFRNPIHERGNPDILGVLCLTECANPALCRDLGIKAEKNRTYRELLGQIAVVDLAARKGPPRARLSWELAARRYCAADPRVAQFRAEVRRIANHPTITDWADTYGKIERKQPVDDLLPFLSSLVSRGFTPVIISEGRSEVQFEKLSRLGLTDFFAGRVLITETAARVPGLAELDDGLSRLMEVELHSLSATTNPELSFLWYYRCLIDAWAGKTPSFYARCLHAIHDQPDAPQDALDRMVYVSREAWCKRPLRFVMVGDRYDKDVAPLMELLGPGVGLCIRLQAGKYGHLHPPKDVPIGRRPAETFGNWDSLASFLLDELSSQQIRPITTPPDLVRRADIRPDYVERGRNSPYEAVRAVAATMGAMSE